jgi:hypothetical protein
MMVEGYRAYLWFQVGEVGMQVSGCPRFDQERRDGERNMVYECHTCKAWPAHLWCIPT